MRYVPAPDDFEFQAQPTPRQDEPIGEVWQWTLDADDELTPEEQVAAENRASVVDDEACPMFLDLFNAIPGIARPVPPRPMMRLVED